MLDFFKSLFKKMKSAMNKEKYKQKYSDLINIFRRVSPLNLSDIILIEDILKELYSDPEIISKKFAPIREAFMKNKAPLNKFSLNFENSSIIPIRRKINIENDVSYVVNGKLICGDVNSSEEEEYFSKNNIDNLNNLPKRKKYCYLNCDTPQCQRCLELKLRKEITQKCEVELQMKNEEKIKKRKVARERMVITGLNEKLGCPSIIGRYLLDDDFSIDDLDSEERNEFLAWKENNNKLSETIKHNYNLNIFNRNEIPSTADNKTSFSILHADNSNAPADSSLFIENKPYSNILYTGSSKSSINPPLFIENEPSFNILFDGSSAAHAQPSDIQIKVPKADDVFDDACKRSNSIKNPFIPAFNENSVQNFLEVNSLSSSSNKNIEDTLNLKEKQIMAEEAPSIKNPFKLDFQPHNSFTTSLKHTQESLKQTESSKFDFKNTNLPNNLNSANPLIIEQIQPKIEVSNSSSTPVSNLQTLTSSEKNTESLLNENIPISQNSFKLMGNPFISQSETKMQTESGKDSCASPLLSDNSKLEFQPLKNTNAFEFLKSSNTNPLEISKPSLLSNNVPSEALQDKNPLPMFNFLGNSSNLSNPFNFGDSSASTPNNGAIVNEDAVLKATKNLFPNNLDNNSAANGSVNLFFNQNNTSEPASSFNPFSVSNPVGNSLSQNQSSSNNFVPKRSLDLTNSISNSFNPISPSHPLMNTSSSLPNSTGFNFGLQNPFNPNQSGNISSNPNSFSILNPNSQSLISNLSNSNIFQSAQNPNDSSNSLDVFGNAEEDDNSNIPRRRAR